MKKNLIGALVGALIIFIWQFLSFAATGLHAPAQRYTEKQTAIMEFLNGQGLEEGGYLLPNMPPGSSFEESMNAEEGMIGKPWVNLQYHKAYEAKMTMNMIRGFLVNAVTVFLFCLLLSRMQWRGAVTIISSAVMIGFIVFLNAPYTNHIWYQTFDIWAHFLDALVSWGLTGLWLSWWLRRGNPSNI